MFYAWSAPLLRILQAMYRIVKWSLDRLFALVALVVTTPLLVLIALVVAADSPGCPFVVQKRDGYKKKTIKVIKFRTMISSDVAFDPDHAVIAREDASVTRVGRFLRRTKLDELPQLINILIGDMSFVGPRPLLPVYTPRYARWEFRKFAVKPGLTGLSQVRGNGYLSGKSRSYYDVLYTETISLWLDLKALILTIGVILRGEDAFLREAPPEAIEGMIKRYESPRGVTRVAEVVGDARIGGVRTSVCNYLSRLDPSAFEIHLFTYGPSSADEGFRKKGWTVHYLPNFILFPAAMRRFRLALSERKYDVVHSHLSALSVFPLAVARSVGVEKRLCHAHNTTSAGDPRALVKNLLKRFALHYATELLACSLHAAKWAYGRRAGKAKILKNAIDLDSFRFCEKTRESVREELAIPPKALVLGCVARLVYQKNIPLLLRVVRAFADKREARLLLVGDGREKDRTKRRIAALGLTDKVCLIEGCDRPERYYHAMDVFLLTSRYEGLGIAAIEAQANGLPCVLSEGVPREVAISEKVRFVKPKVESFLEAIEGLDLTRTDNRAALRAAGYDIEREKGKLAAIYRDKECDK